jgi:hypothetical protein
MPSSKKAGKDLLREQLKLLFLNIQNQERTNRRTRDKPQWIVAQRLLSHLQYPDPTKSSTKDLSLTWSNLKLVRSIFGDWNRPLKLGEPISFHVATLAMKNVA